jgi:Transglutaminase-like superfamily
MKGSLLKRPKVTRWLLIMEAWWGLLRAAIRIRIQWRRRELLENAMQPIPGMADTRQEAAIRTAINSACRLQPKPMHCLEQGLAFVWMLRRRGIAGHLQVGCRREGSLFRFHAWVTGIGVPTPGQNEIPFSPLVSCGSGFPA